MLGLLLVLVFGEQQKGTGMDYTTLVTELKNARPDSSYLVRRKLDSLIVYLTKLQETGNYIIAQEFSDALEY